MLMGGTVRDIADGEELGEIIKDATNQPKELPPLWVFHDLRLSLPHRVGQVLRRVFASTGKMSCLHETSFPAVFCAHP